GGPVRALRVAMFRWFERQIDPFPSEPFRQPPGTLLAFYWHFIEPVWPTLAILLVAGFIGSIIEVSLFAFLGTIVDPMKEAENPAGFFTDHGWSLIGMALVALVARPIFSTLHDLIKNQLITGPLTTRIRWQSHGYVLRQSLGFFQNDFAGRVAAKVLQ